MSLQKTLYRLASKLISRPVRKSRKRQKPYSLSFNTFEPRRMLAGVDLDTSTGDLVIFGGSENDVASAAVINSTVRVTFNGVGTFDYPRSQVSKLVFIGFAGDDTFTNNTSITSQMLGHLGNDTIRGGSGDDLINGGPGNDVLFGNAGNDKILGVRGTDELQGGTGNDRIFGSIDGPNIIKGSLGDDFIFGGNQDDNIEGNDGVDEIYALGGNDTILTGAGFNDLAMGHDGDDTITGFNGRDRMYGGNGNDTMTAGPGGPALMFGNSGADELIGGPFEDELRGNAGNDNIYGGGRDDRLVGGPGDDSLYGGAGVDALFGQDGNDGLFGGIGGTDTEMLGGNGADRFLIYGSDRAQDKAFNDVNINLADASATWSDSRVEKIDVGLRALHQRTQSTRVFKDPLDTREMTIIFERAGTLSSGESGRNGLGWTAEVDSNGRLFNEVYTRTIQIEAWDVNQVQDEWAALTMIHEIAHSWDSAFEIDQVVSGSGSLFTSYVSRGGWRNTPASGFTQASNTQEPFDRDANHNPITRSWYRSNTAEFPRNYGRTNAQEDWATAWESIFVDQIVENPNTSHAQIVPVKASLVNTLFDRF